MDQYFNLIGLILAGVAIAVIATLATRLANSRRYFRDMKAKLKETEIKLGLLQRSAAERRGLEPQISRIDHKPGDVFVMHILSTVPMEVAGNIKAKWKEVFGENAPKLIILDRGAKLSAIDAAQARPDIDSVVDDMRAGRVSMNQSRNRMGLDPIPPTTGSGVKPPPPQEISVTSGGVVIGTMSIAAVAAAMGDDRPAASEPSWSSDNSGGGGIDGGD